MVGRLLSAVPRPAPNTESHPLIPSWVRVLVILTIIPVWAVVVLYSLIFLDSLPGAEWTIVPSAIITAVAPAWRIRRGGEQAESAETEAAPAASEEEGTA